MGAPLNKLTTRERLANGHGAQRQVEREIYQGELLAALLHEQRRTNELLQWIATHLHGRASQQGAAQPPAV